MASSMGERIKKNKSLEDRLAAVEKFVSILKWSGSLLTIFGLSAGGVLWFGYNGLKEQEIKIRKDFSGLQKEYCEAQENINRLRAENADTFASALDKYDRMSESYLELRKNVTKASEESSVALEKAGNLVLSVEQACDAAARAEKTVADNKKLLEESRVIAEKVTAIGVTVQESQLALEEFVAKRLNEQTKKSTQVVTFTVEITGSSVTCSFVDGVSAPYSRKISGAFAETVVTVPESSICIVKVSGPFCTIKIKRLLQGRVIVEGGGSSCTVKYI